MPANLSRNPAFHYFASFRIVSLKPFISKQESSREMTIFVMSSKKYFKKSSKKFT